MLMNMFINWNYKLTIQHFQISSTYHQHLYMLHLEANTKAKGVASLSTLEFESEGEQLVVTTKLINPIRRETNLKLIPLPIIQ